MMKKIALSTFFLFFPVWAIAASSSSSFSFAPPPGDVSVIFLSNLFGIVDGVLHGTGSQIMGAMFGVFNSFVLAIGGAVIMYTLVVSTMNTAQEGQMLGQKWSSIWVPLRSTLGLALLIPKASGYCLMQIFVMWVIVQGVGAADKVWAAALSYLNRGGTLVQAQMPPQISLTSGKSTIATGAATILQGQVCMYGLQQILQQKLQGYMDSKRAKVPTGACIGAPSPELKAFCDSGQVPDFLSTVNVVAEQNKNPNSLSNYSVPMPNFTPPSTYATLNGICGTISWSPIEAINFTRMEKNISALSKSEIDTAKMSRAIAIQQMYSTLSTMAKLMVLNNPAINPAAGRNTGNQSNFSTVAVQQFGVPYLDSGSPCLSSNPQCTSWGKDPSNNNATPLFSGVEFQGAIADYNGIMSPTLTLIEQAKEKSTSNQKRQFIQQANNQGWMLAGSYFINMAMLSADSSKSSNLTDNDTGLETSTFDAGEPLSPFSSQGCTGTRKDLCLWLQNQSAPIPQLIAMINGSNKLLDAPLLLPRSMNPVGLTAIKGIGSSTVNGFLTNSLLVNLPGQGGMTPPSFAMKMNIEANFGQFKLEYQDFPCSGFLCIGSTLGNIFYNYIFRFVFNLFLSILAPFFNTIIQTVLIGPLIAISQIFQQNVAIIQQPTANPIVALANMGANYINFANELWITIIGMSVTPLISLLMPLLALILPLLMTWLGIMVAIGFVTAYYVPFLPYMIFTFASIAWLIAVIEAMVAAPIVALGVTHPEGHDAFGKGEHAIMILMNVFLRPAMMIIGYIAAIALSFVSVWLINAGFANAAAFIQGIGHTAEINVGVTQTWNANTNEKAAEAANNFSSMKSGYVGWAGVYGFFFSVLIYTTMYVTVVQKAFMLITYLPDKVLRWVGGQAEGIGEQSAQWAEGEVKKGVEGGGDKTSQAAATRDKQLSGYVAKLAGKGKDATKPKDSDIEALGESTPE